MKIALISDIHGNIPALTAVLKDIKEKKIDKIYCLGDIVGKGPNPEEAMKIIRENCDKNILGNWDDFLLYSPVHELPIDWYREHISHESYDYLKTLPYHISFNMAGFRISAFHAHPENVYKRTHQKFATEHKLELFSPIEDEIIPDLAIYGDIHYSFIEQLNHHAILANTGSIGNPLDGNNSKYIILEGNEEVYESKASIQLKPLDPNHYVIESSTGRIIKISLEEVAYDTAQAIKDADNSNMPEKEYYKKEIETGEYRYMDKWK
ncbi:MAG: metallophosphoesterase family protein [Filifactoraceae bacterium]